MNALDLRERSRPPTGSARIHMSTPYRLSSLLCVLSIIALPALADYGPKISGRWVTGAKMEAKGDYANAVKQYEQALAASPKLDFKGLDKKELDTLRACATSGSEARLAGARAGMAALRPTTRPLASARRASSRRKPLERVRGSGSQTAGFGRGLSLNAAANRSTTALFVTLGRQPVELPKENWGQISVCGMYWYLYKVPV